MWRENWHFHNLTRSYKLILKFFPMIWYIDMNQRNNSFFIFSILNSRKSWILHEMDTITKTTNSNFEYNLYTLREYPVCKRRYQLVVSTGWYHEYQLHINRLIFGWYLVFDVYQLVHLNSSCWLISTFTYQLSYINRRHHISTQISTCRRYYQKSGNNIVKPLF